MRISDWSSDVCSSDLKISEALKEMDEQQIWAFLDHFEEETLARAKMLSDLGYGGGGVDDVDDLIEETGRRRANVRGTGESPGQALGKIGRASCRERVCQYV